jgi:aspartyl-tRNA(Asn)/glutamyl-tRNA(Gln) amidotransferase subunit A
VDSETVAAIEQALVVLAGLGASVREVTIPHIEHARTANQVIMMAEAFAYHEHNLKTRRQDYGAMVLDRFLLGGLFTQSDYVQAQRVRRLVQEEMAQVLREVDVMVTPTFPKPAALIEGYDGAATMFGPSFTGPFNITGLPAISVPGGFTQAGLPIGLQVIGQPFAESMVLRVSHAYEQEARWNDTRPPI